MHLWININVTVLLHNCKYSSPMGYLINLWHIESVEADILFCDSVQFYLFIFWTHNNICTFKDATKYLLTSDILIMISGPYDWLQQYECFYLYAVLKLGLPPGLRLQLLCSLCYSKDTEQGYRSCYMWNGFMCGTVIVRKCVSFESWEKDCVEVCIM